LNPTDADAWNNLGMISGEEEKYEEALEEFRQAVFANPNYLLGLQNMLRIYQYQARPADAQKALEELIARAPNNSDLHLGLAMALLAGKDSARALKELETAVRLRPDNTDAINNLGALLLRMGRAPEALARFEECRRLAPDFDRPYINAALIYKAAGQPAKARELLDEFLARHPDNADVRSAREKIGP
jgi:Flp pilus assembly protein TadD